MWHRSGATVATLLFGPSCHGIEEVAEAEPGGLPRRARGGDPVLVLWKWWLLSYQKPLPATPFMAGSGDGWSAPFVVFGTVSESGQPSPSPWA